MAHLPALLILWCPLITKPCMIKSSCSAPPPFRLLAAPLRQAGAGSGGGTRRRGQLTLGGGEATRRQPHATLVVGGRGEGERKLRVRHKQLPVLGQAVGRPWRRPAQRQHFLATVTVIIWNSFIDLTVILKKNWGIFSKWRENYSYSSIK